MLLTINPARLAEIREQIKNKFPSWTAMQDLLDELDALQAQAEDPYEAGFLVKFVEAHAREELPENRSVWERVVFALVKGNQHHEQDRASTARLATLLEDPTYHLCPTRSFKTACPYPSVCAEAGKCVDGEVPY